MKNNGSYSKHRLTRPAVVCGLLCLLFGWLVSYDYLPVGYAQQSAAETQQPQVMLLPVNGPIGPATTEYLEDSLDEAQQQSIELVILLLDTPGGLSAATRDIIKAIRSSSVPVATFVAPEGARAASAGTYILYASHIAAVAPATNVGAATPVSIGGGAPAPAEQPDTTDDNDGSKSADGESNSDQNAADRPVKTPANASERKALNDAAAWIRGLAQETGRNADWAEMAVREAVSLTAQEALQQNVIDLLADDIDDLLEQIDGRTVTVLQQPITLATANAAQTTREPGWRSRFLSVITNPTFAYILLMIGIYGLLLEGYSPGSLVPGTVGAIALLTALYAFQVLPVNYAGLLLIGLGAILMVAEAFVPSFGALGIGGVVAVIFGSVILMDTDAPGFNIAIEAIIAVAALAGTIMAGLILLAVRSWRQPVVSGGQEILTATGTVIDPVSADQGQVWVLSERWQARSHQPLPVDTEIRVTGRDGLVLQVAPCSDNESNEENESC